MEINWVLNGFVGFVYISVFGNWLVNFVNVGVFLVVFVGGEEGSWFFFCGFVIYVLI